MTKLPEWLDALVPKLTPPVKLEYFDGNYYAHYPEGDTYPEHTLGDPFTTFVDAYESVKSNLGWTVTFDETLPETKDLLFEGFITLDAGNGRHRAFISSTEADNLMLLENSWEKWMKFAESEYLNHTDDFLCAYYFVDRHPCFWTRTTDSNARVGWHDHWITSGHTQRLEQTVSFDPNSPTKINFTFETGPHHGPDYKIHSCDLRLEVSGSSYEEAIINLAEKVHKFYNLDGSPRENVEYEPSPLEKLLVERLEADRARQPKSDITDPDTTK